MRDIPDNFKYHKFAAIMTYARSGSNLLGSLLNSHPDVEFLGPVFGRRRDGWTGPCYKLRGSYQAILLCLDKFITKYHGKQFVLDIKYPWITPAVEKLLDKILVIHLIRRDATRRFFSSILWERIKKNPYLLVNSRRPQFEIKKKHISEDETKIRNLCKRFEHHEDLRLYYEQLTNNKQIDRLSEESSFMLCDFLGVQRRILTTTMVKLSPTQIEDFIRLK